MVTESRIELDVPDLHLSAPLLDRPSTAGQLQGAGVSLPFWVEGRVSTPCHFIRQKGQPDQMEYESIQLHIALHRGLPPIAQGKGNPLSPKLSYSYI